MLREAVETPGGTAMLVSPDRALARRVAARLAAWGLDIEDLGGEPFAKTGPGAFLELVATAAQPAIRAGRADDAAEAPAVPRSA